MSTLFDVCDYAMYLDEHKVNLTMKGGIIQWQRVHNVIGRERYVVNVSGVA